MKLEFNAQESKFLQNVLRRHLDEMRRELTHTDNRALHAELARDVGQLEEIVARVDRSLDEASVYA
jgi:transposase